MLTRLTVAGLHIDSVRKPLNLKKYPKAFQDKRTQNLFLYNYSENIEKANLVNYNSRKMLKGSISAYMYIKYVSMQRKHAKM